VTPVPGTTTLAPGTQTPAPISPRVRERFVGLAKNLVDVEIRITELSRQAANVSNTALLTNDRGPQSDVNLTILPKGKTNLIAGVNDLSANQTWNLAATQTLGPGVRLGGGILYSRLGILGEVRNGIFGVETRAYDLRRGTLDAYVHVRPFRYLDLFAGQRDLTRPQRRSAYGLELEFP